MKFYIIERHNPQLTRPTYRALGKVSKARAANAEKTLYGTNKALSFTTEADYQEKCRELGISPA